MKLLMENWRKFLKEETSVERMQRRREENRRKREEEGAARDEKRAKEKRLKSGEWTQEDKEYILLTYEDEIEDFEETYGRKPRKMEILQYITKRPDYFMDVAGVTQDPSNPLTKQIGSKAGDFELAAVRLGDVYTRELKRSILPLPGKSGFDQWAERAERESGGKPQDVAREMIRWMKAGAVISNHPYGIEAGLRDAQIGTILRLTHLTPDDIFQNMEMLVKSGKSAEQAAQDISSTDEGATRTNPNYNPNEGPSMDNPDFDPDEDESDENPKRIKNPRTIPMVIADPKIILRMYKYYKAAGL